jgi:chaperonin GroES
MLKITGARVLVLRDEAETKTTSGIILTEKSQEPPKTGKIVSVGPGVRGSEGQIIPMEVFVGDQIIYADFSGTEVTDIDGVKYTLLNERDILAVVTK